MTSRIYHAIRNLAIVVLFAAAAVTIHAQMTSQDTVSVTATVAQDNIVIFSGDACPACQVFLLLENAVADWTTAQSDGSFQLNVEDIAAINHQFGVYAIDRDGVQSGTSSFSVDVSQGAIIYVSDILVSPTLRISSPSTAQGDEATLSGFSVPNGEVTIEIDGTAIVIQTNSAASDGGFYYDLDTSSLALGGHNARAFVETATDTSGYSKTVDFQITEQAEAEQEDEDDDGEGGKTGDAEAAVPAQDAIEQQIQQVQQEPPTGKPIDFAVIVANEGSRVTSGEFLELRLVIIHVREDFKGKQGELAINVFDVEGNQLFGEFSTLDLAPGAKMTRKIKINCPNREGEFVARAEIAVEQQRITEEAAAVVARGADCKCKTGLETNLVAPGAGFISLCGYLDWLVAILALLLLIVLFLLFLLFSRKKEAARAGAVEDPKRNGDDSSPGKQE